MPAFMRNQKKYNFLTKLLLLHILLVNIVPQLIVSVVSHSVLVVSFLRCALKTLDYRLEWCKTTIQNDFFLP
jgi:hypothetical protein